MNDLRGAAQQALEALEDMDSDDPELNQEWLGKKAIEDLRAALAQPEQEPVAWIRQRDNKLALSDGGVFGDDWTPLYAHPPQRQPLTEEQIELAYREIWRNLSDGFSHTSAEWIETGIRYAEKAHGIE